jgi:hypothetical protein
LLAVQRVLGDAIAHALLVLVRLLLRHLVRSGRHHHHHRALLYPCEHLHRDHCHAVGVMVAVAV